jgi:hypothetical protein
VPDQPDGWLVIKGFEGRSQRHWIQPYQKALMGTVPVLSSANEYLYTVLAPLPEVPVSVIVALAEIVPWAWRLQAANPAAKVKAQRLEIILVFIFCRVFCGLLHDLWVIFGFLQALFDSLYHRLTEFSHIAGEPMGGGGGVCYAWPPAAKRTGIRKAVAAARPCAEAHSGNPTLTASG